MSNVSRLLTHLTTFLGGEGTESFKLYLDENDPGLLTSLYLEESLPSDQKSTNVSKYLKHQVDRNDMEGVQSIIDRGLSTPEDVCVMAAQRGNTELVKICLDAGVRPTNEVFTSACLSGNIQLAQEIESRLVANQTENYNPSETYQGVDYLTGIYGSIAKSKPDMVKWLMVKTVSPDYVTIGNILPRVKSQEVVSMVVNGTPEINKQTVKSQLLKLQLSDSEENLKAAVAYGKWELASKILELSTKSGSLFKIPVATRKSLAVTALLSNRYELVTTYLLKNLPEKDVELFVTKHLVDCQSVEGLRSLMKLSDGKIDERIIVRASAKVGDFETLNGSNWKSHGSSLVEGAALGNRISLIESATKKHPSIRSAINKRTVLKLLPYMRMLGYESMERFLLSRLDFESREEVVMMLSQENVAAK
jgi:hypothetical protein